MVIKKKISKKNILIYSLIGLIFTAILFVNHFSGKEKQEPAQITNNYSNCVQILYASAPISPADVLNDKNDIHLIHATKNGLKEPFATNEEFEHKASTLVKDNILVALESNDYYKIKTLRHSHPYLIPEAAEMVNEIANRFNEKIKDYKVGDYRIMLTSLLRTAETQTKLSKRNGNAAPNSAHLYGTTIDISYKDFYNVDKHQVEQKWEAIQALTKVLVEMRKECKILGVRERKQSCFHLTVVACEPSKLETNPPVVVPVQEVKLTEKIKNFARRIKRGEFS